MVENDTFAYLMNKPLIDQKSRVFHYLITQERTRKLELLVHLIANSRQTLVVSAPKVSVINFLKVLQERKIDSWLYCLVQGNAELSFENIHEQTAQVINQGKPESQVQVLSDAFRRLESQHKKIV